MPCAGKPLAQGASLGERVHWALRQSRQPLGIYAIADLLTEATGRRHFPNSIYRILHRMRAAGEVVSVASADGWQVCEGPAGGTVLVLICTACGCGYQEPAGDLAEALQAIAAEMRFQIVHHNLELLGCCSACAVHAPEATGIARDRRLDRQAAGGQ